jgi:hypothetical protein
VNTPIIPNFFLTNTIDLQRQERYRQKLTDRSNKYYENSNKPNQPWVSKPSKSLSDCSILQATSNTVRGITNGYFATPLLPTTRYTNRSETIKLSNVSSNAHPDTTYEKLSTQPSISIPKSSPQWKPHPLNIRTLESRRQKWTYTHQVNRPIKNNTQNQLDYSKVHF